MRPGARESEAPVGMSHLSQQFDDKEIVKLEDCLDQLVHMNVKIYGKDAAI